MGKWILIPDSFKGTMSSEEICTVMAAALRRHLPEADIVSIPVADGGEGSVDAFLAALGGRREKVPCTGPDGRPITAFYGRLPDGTAVVEMAAAAGLPLMEGHLCAEGTTTYGVGELLRAAVHAGAKRVILGLGGSATNDGGCGCAAALGIRFLDRDGVPFVPVGGTLDRLDRIDASGLDPAARAADITVMCDIDNPLCGPTGASAVFGPQKGAGPEMVARLDRNLGHLADIIRRDLGMEIRDLPGSGAAGGMGGGMVAFFGSTLQMGIETVLDTVGFDKLLEGADMVFSGEGKLDAQSLLGKVVIGVARRAKRAGVPLVAVVGDIGDNIEAAYDMGVSAVFSINRVAVPFREAKPRSKSDLALTMDNLMRFCRRMGW